MRMQIFIPWNEDRSGTKRKYPLLCKIFCPYVVVGRRGKRFLQIFHGRVRKECYAAPLARLHLFSYNLLLRSSLSLWSGLFGQRMSWSWPKMQQSFRERPATNAGRDFAVPLPSVELCFSFARLTILHLLTITCPTRFLNIHQEFRGTLFPVFFAIRYIYIYILACRRSFRQNFRKYT